MKYQRLLLAFVAISTVSFLYEKYKSKYEKSRKEKFFINREAFIKKC